MPRHSRDLRREKRSLAVHLARTFVDLDGGHLQLVCKRDNDNCTHKDSLFPDGQ